MTQTQGEPPLSVSDANVASMVESVARTSLRTDDTPEGAEGGRATCMREFAVTAAMKLTARLPAQVCVF